MTRILIVDDSLTVRKLVRREMEQDGFEVFDVSNAQEAITKIPQIKPDVITLDVEMPGMNGFDFCRLLRFGQEGEFPVGQEFSQIPVIFLTANANLEMRTHGFEVGADEYLTKPPVQGEIQAAVSRILSKRNHFFEVTALVVDDSAMVRSLLERVLTHEGITVFTASQGKKALTILKTQEVDIILTDLVMPEMDGVELCRKIRKELGMMEIPILFLTSAANKESLLDIFQAGATDYLLKPLVTEELFARMNVHLREKKLKEELFSKVQQLNEANRIKDDFLSIASHDLRSPLNGILGFAQLLEMEEDLSPDAREYISYIQNSGRFLLALINDLLDLSRLQAEREEIFLTEVDLYKLSETAIGNLKHMAIPKKIQLTLINEVSGVPWVWGNVNALTQVLNNLLSNAIKFTPSGGQVILSLNQEKGVVIAKVRDTGIGIPPKNLDKLFDKFTSAGQEGTAGEKSTGLGLHITKNQVERMQGEISVESTLGMGTIFTVSLPQPK